MLMCQRVTKNRDFLTDRPLVNKITQTLSKYIHIPFCIQRAKLSNATINTKTSHDHIVFLIMSFGVYAFALDFPHRSV